jgi:Zn-finger protein
MKRATWYKRIYWTIVIWVKDLFEEKSTQTTFCYCPKCNNELCGSNSFIEDLDYVYYKCSKCGHGTKWDFDTWMIPVIVDEKGKPIQSI